MMCMACRCNTEVMLCAYLSTFAQGAKEHFCGKESQLALWQLALGNDAQNETQIVSAAVNAELSALSCGTTTNSICQ